MSDSPGSNDSGLAERFRRIVKTACVNMSDIDKQSAPAICNKLLNGSGEFRAQLVAVNDLGNWSISKGFNPCIRRYILKTPNEVPSEQLALFATEEQRKLVGEIGKAVYVPERNGFAPLIPGKITAEELKSAGNYLIEMGEDTIRRGGLCILLAKHMRNTRRSRRG